MSALRFLVVRRRRALLTPALLLVFAGCSRVPPGATSAERTVIDFTNESLAQADVFVAVPGSEGRRLGTVMAGRSESLVVPPEIAIKGNITLFARLLARSATPSSGAIAISPGTHLSVRLPLDERALYVLPGGA
jgi:hypothetical protein